MAATVTEIKQTTCPYCGVGCGVDSTVRDGNLIAVSGTKIHPANKGRLCVKGTALHETTDLQTRLLYPQIHGEQVSWDSALDAVADGFSSTIAEHGPQSVAFYLSGQLMTEDYYVANKLMKGFIGSANVDTNSRLCMASAAAGYKRAFGEDVVPCNYRDLELCDLLVIVGSNAAWTHPVLYQRIKAAKEQRPEMKVVVIDPRVTATCEIADLHLQIKAGTDAYLFVGLLHYLHRRQRLNNQYIDAHTQGFAAALDAARALDDSEALAEQLGISLDSLDLFYTWFAETEKTVTFYSQGINQSATGTDKCNAIINCHLATGRLGREGMGPFSITGQPNAMGGREVGGFANQLAAHMDFTADNVARVGRFWQSDNMATEPGLKAVDMFDAIDRGEIKAVWIMATNPVVSLPNADRVKAALQKCPLVVVSDSVAKTDTTACAHILLPATEWGEKDGTVTNSERCISRQPALRQAAGEARHDWQIISQVAARMGFASAFNYDCPRDIFCEHAALSGFENKGDRYFNISELANISATDYKNLTPFQWPLNTVTSSVRNQPFADGRFVTPDGRAKFVAVIPQRPAMVSGGDYVLNTGRVRDQWHTMTRTARADRLLNHIDAPFLSIHLDDADALAVGTGDLVEVSNGCGRINLAATIDNGVRKGELFAPIHWNDQFASASRVDTLTPAVTDPVSGQPQSKYMAVSLRKLQPRCWLQLVCAREIDMATMDYWVKTPLKVGVRYQAALFDREPGDMLRWAKSQAKGDSLVEFIDQESGDFRLVSRLGEQLDFMVFASSRRQWQPDGSWLGAAFAGAAADNDWLLCAGKSAAGSDKGRLVCSCFEVGEKDIARAIASGARTTRALGEQLRCGTNCGSCIPELKGLIDTCGEAASAPSCSAA